MPVSCAAGLERGGAVCVPRCGRGEEYVEARGGCRPTDDTCEGDPDLTLVRDSSGYCVYAWGLSPSGNDITYEPVGCDVVGEFSAEANADTYINTDLRNKADTRGKSPMCPPTGLFLALGERRRTHDHATDYYLPEWAVEADLKDRHLKVVARATGDCTIIGDVVEVYGQYAGSREEFIENLPEVLKNQ